MKIPFRRHSLGFTLIELLVVLSIMSFIASIIFAQTQTSKAKARNANRFQVMREVQKALEFYRNDFGSYPDTGGEYRAGSSNCTSNDAGTTIVDGFGYGSSGYIDGLVPTYIGQLPEDPQQLPDRCFVYASDGNDYILISYNGAEDIDADAHQLDRRGVDGDNSFAVYTSGAVDW